MSNAELKKQAFELFPSCFKHANSASSVRTIGDNVILQFDSISDTYIRKLDNRTMSIVHCDHFGIKTREDFVRLNRECAKYLSIMRNKHNNVKTIGKNKILSFSDFLLLEEKRNVILKKLERSIGNDILYSYEMNYVPDNQLMNKCFDILNETVFQNALPKVHVMCLTQQDMQKIIDDCKCNRDAKELYALYIPYGKFNKISTAQNVVYDKIQDYILINASNGPMNFAFAINSLCHEMIHFHDVVNGNLLELAYQKIFYGQDFDDHSTEKFKEKENFCNKHGLTIIPDRAGESLETLCKLSAFRFNKFKAITNEDEDQIEDPPFLGNVANYGKSQFTVCRHEDGSIGVAF